MLLSGIKEIDKIILSHVDSQTFSHICDYFIKMLEEASFWRLRLYNKFNIKSINTNINYKAIVDLLDNNITLDQIYLGTYTELYEQLTELTIDNNPIFLLTDMRTSLSYLNNAIVDNESE